MSGIFLSVLANLAHIVSLGLAIWAVVKIFKDTASVKGFLKYFAASVLLFYFVGALGSVFFDLVGLYAGCLVQLILGWLLYRRCFVISPESRGQGRFSWVYRALALAVLSYLMGMISSVAVMAALATKMG